MAGDESRVTMFLDRTLQNVNHSRELHDVRLIIQAPIKGIHQPIIRIVHGLVHPDGIGNMNAHLHTQLTTPLEQRIHSGIIRMHAVGIHRARSEAFPLIVQLADSTRPRLVTAF